MEVLVTGGDTELGRVVAEGFHNDGHTITQDRLTTALRTVIDPGVRGLRENGGLREASLRGNTLVPIGIRPIPVPTVKPVQHDFVMPVDRHRVVIRGAVLDHVASECRRHCRLEPVDSVYPVNRDQHGFAVGVSAGDWNLRGFE